MHSLQKRQRMEEEDERKGNAYLAEKRALLTRLEMDLAAQTTRVSVLSDKILEALEKGNSTLKEELEKREKEAKEQQQEIKTQVAAVRKEVESLSLMSPAPKKMEKADLSNSFGIARFFLEQFGAKRVRIDSEEDVSRDEAVYEFSSHLFNDKTTPTTVFIRQCYREQAKSVHEWMGTKQEKEVDEQLSVFVGGARGVGKSILGVLMAFEFLDLGYVVLYEHKDAKLLLVGPKLRPEQRDALSSALEHKGYVDVSGEPGVYIFNDPDDLALFRRCTILTEPIHVQDFGDGGKDGINLDGKTRRLMLSSPRDERLRLLHKTIGTTKRIFMPLWSVEELIEAQRRCFPLLTEEQVRTRYQKYGGIARHVLEHSDQDADQIFQSNLHTLSYSMMKNIFSSGNYESLPSFSNVGYIFHVRPGPSSGEFRVAFASGYAFDSVVRRFVQQNLSNAKQFALFLREHQQLAGVYGQFLEHIVHMELSRPQSSSSTRSFEVSRLNPDSSARDNVEAAVQRTWPECAEVMFHHLAALESVEPNTYYHPYSRVYETIDAFALIDGSLLDPAQFARGMMVLVLIQVTVSNTHKVSGAKVREVHKDVYEKWSGNPAPSSDKDLCAALPRILVFVTRKFPKGVHSYQTVSTTKDEAYKTPFVLAQYALVMEREFEQVWGVLDGEGQGEEAEY